MVTFNLIPMYPYPYTYSLIQSSLAPGDRETQYPPQDTVRSFFAISILFTHAIFCLFVELRLAPALGKRRPPGPFGSVLHYDRPK